MDRRCFAVFALLASLALVAPTGMAGQGKGQGKGKGNPHASKKVDRDDDRWERRDDYEYRVFGDRDDRPPGWSRGKKTGWGNCGLPPGQAKKYGCRTYVYQGRPHYYYRDEQGRIVVRRPVIQVHGDADIH
jgi:hypothetical protein